MLPYLLNRNWLKLSMDVSVDDFGKELVNLFHLKACMPLRLIIIIIIILLLLLLLLLLIYYRMKQRKESWMATCGMTRHIDYYQCFNSMSPPLNVLLLLHTQTSSSITLILPKGKTSKFKNLEIFAETCDSVENIRINWK